MSDIVHSSAYCVEITNGPQDTHCGACVEAMHKEIDRVPCRICEAENGDPEDGLCFQCWVRRDKAEAEYIAIFTRGGTR